MSGSADRTVRVWEVSPVVRAKKGDAKEQHVYSDWHLREDGWIVGTGGELLAWIPEDMRGTLWSPQNSAFFSCRFSLKLDFDRSPLGKDWSKGFPHPNKPTPKGTIT